ncbi:CorA family divalent cation transporter [Muricomes intestini]|jgi:magnesium transporter|uniref:Magnesium transporter n=1 Tax=Muricomes intestini TaxID=1796634 RepID=A0A4R3K2W9_9FIRM|nr:CorA family divalent cation transporter [Muricomes intestini]TCS77035.1 magnesium transporter [Muricomes intestini]
MIKYFLKEKLMPLSETTDFPEKCGAITVLTSDEYDAHFRETEHYRMLKASLSHIHYCKADVMNGFTIGTLSIPPRGKQRKGFCSFAFYMTDSELIFVDDQNFTIPLLKQMEDYPLSDARSTAHFFLAFLEYLIKDDVFFLQHFEETLTKLEEAILARNDSSFNHRILLIRKELAALGAFYEQLQDMGEDLEEGPLSEIKESAAPLFGLFTAKAGRLYSNVQMLKEYSMQLREMHQTQVDMHQNQIMKFLTIVTTIFMPLTLITGWYGMNFTHMPELESSYGYIIICVLSLLIVLVEIWLFKIKDWFD